MRQQPPVRCIWLSRAIAKRPSASLGEVTVFVLLRSAGVAAPQLAAVSGRINLSVHLVFSSPSVGITAPQLAARVCTSLCEKELAPQRRLPRP